MGGLRGFDLGFYLLAEGGGDVDEGVEEESADAFAKEIFELWWGTPYEGLQPLDWTHDRHAEIQTRMSAYGYNSGTNKEL
jgi:hypothetical protein